MAGILTNVLRNFYILWRPCLFVRIIYQKMVYKVQITRMNFTQVALHMTSRHLCPHSPWTASKRDSFYMSFLYILSTLPRLQGRYLDPDVLSLQNCIFNLFSSPSLYLLFNTGLLDETFFLIYPCFPLPKTTATGHVLSISFSLGQILFPGSSFCACLFDTMGNWTDRKARRWLRNWCSPLSSCNIKFPFLQVPLTGMDAHHKFSHKKWVKYSEF